MCVTCVGEEAKRVYDDAQALLNRLINSKGLQARGIVGFWRAQSHGDDILVYTDDVTPTLSNHTATFHGIRQQVTLHSRGLGEDKSIICFSFMFTV